MRKKQRNIFVFFFSPSQLCYVIDFCTMFVTKNAIFRKNQVDAKVKDEKFSIQLYLATKLIMAFN
jgi:hypothetical protein